ncbi:putative adhesin [Desulfovibrio cuneatus]|uniref:putative adhesin n=1 Tax=Desulfovibrio cuneatus TaxID=159728 RepID=UPI000485E492|nr:hypothetical protein [Desulfovibrio cuneatus]
MRIQRTNGEYLILGHGSYPEGEAEWFGEFTAPEGIELILLAVPNAAVKIRLGQAMVNNEICDLCLRERTTSEIKDANYTPRTYRADEQVPSYRLQHAPEIRVDGATGIISPSIGGNAAYLADLVRQIPVRQGKTTRCYVACCAGLQGATIRYSVDLK